MKKYAKINQYGGIEFLRNIPNVINPSEAMWDDYAAKHGYKEYVQVPSPGKYYSKKYTETEKTVTDTWIPFELDTAKQNAMDNVQRWLDSNLSIRTTIDCKGIDNGIIYDENALVNAMGIEDGDAFIDANDGIHILTEELIKNIKAALKGYRQSIYLKATVKRANINAATNVDEVEEAENKENDEIEEESQEDGNLFNEE